LSERFRNGSPLVVQRAYIDPGSSWENGYIESFNARELRNGEIFYALREAQIIIESWAAPRSATNHQHRRFSCPHSPPATQLLN
jgi:putative transposase